ncbi:Vegetative incompatibility HET-E-1 [Fusarium albosuccineum]|uniref:Vegetative incompatibility HET-E-1 n=1 Tax=Fusarium albosuccineum TaxID=1237068 RepID=A0A8H4KLK6_9HYPO|nr:Vegetative incompatibility HET-E-1 [Fusarium albosuccineum]
MRVISATKFAKGGEIRFEEFYGHNITPYAILSHTWEDGQEVTFEDCKSSVAKNKKGYSKIQKTCQLAVDEGIDYIWIDTCCIDKSSSAELTEAINSMYQWYERAEVCYAYLSDLDGGDLKDCRWFTRGWTLQELIAPNNMKFFDHSWENVGDKASLLEQLSTITSIEARILSHQDPLWYACVAKRFSWAAKRKNTRDEDIAYCLLGIFNINMPMLYGEGFKAFVRLQEEIIRTTNDLSIFAWTRHNSSTNDQTPYQNFLAEGPQDFASCSNLRLATDPLLNGNGMSITNKGIHMEGHHWVSEYKDGTTRYSLGLRCRSTDDKPIMVPMRKAGPNAFVRATNASRLDTSSLGIASSYTVNSKSFTLLTRLHREQLTSDKIVSIFRHVAVAVEFPSDISKRNIRAIPQRYWDAEEFVFFQSRQHGAILGLC